MLRPPLGASAFIFSQKKSKFLLKEFTSDVTFFKMSFHPSVSGCDRFLALSDSHDCCITCFGVKHVESAFVDESCSHCESMTITALRSRLHYIKRGGVRLAMHHSSASSSKKGRNTSASGQGSLRVTVKASPRRKFPWAPRSSSTSQPVEFQSEVAGPSKEGPSISFGAPVDDMMSITASEDELGSREEDSAMLPPSGMAALPESDPAMLSQAAESVELQSLECSSTWGCHTLIASTHPQCLSSQRCMKKSLGLGRHLILPETGLVFLPSSCYSNAVMSAEHCCMAG